MTYRFGAEHMCDSGIEDTIDGIKDAVRKLVIEHFEGMPLVGKSCAEHVDENLDEAFEGVVQDIDEHLGTVKTEAHDEGYESGMESACKERDELQEQVDELEVSKNEITFEGEVFRYVPERQVFVSRIGTVLALSRTETEMVSICTVW